MDNKDPAPTHAASIYLELVHAEESEILTWAVKTAISDLGTEIRHSDNLAMRTQLHERKKVLLMLLKRLMVVQYGPVTWGLRNEVTCAVGFNDVEGGLMQYLILCGSRVLKSISGGKAS